MKLNVDGVDYNVLVTSLHRSFELYTGSAEGTVLNGRKKRDVKGTYYNYSMTVSPISGSEADYDALYEVLSAPVESHVVKVPYAQETRSFEVGVSSGEDEVISSRGTKNMFRELNVTLEAMEPARRAT